MNPHRGTSDRWLRERGRTAAVRAAVVLLATGAALAVPAGAGAAPGSVRSLRELGGFTLTASATPVAIQIFEPMIPIPTEPQLELDLSFSRANFSTGPTGRAVSSLLWPGDGVGYGLPQLLNNPDLDYPVKVGAAHPSGPADAKQEVLPGTGMTAHADDSTIRAAAAIAKPTLPTLSIPGVPVPTMLVAVEAFSSESTTTVTADAATAAAYATAGSISLLGGLVKIDGLRIDTQAVSDGAKGTTSGTVTWGSLTLAGQKFAVTQAGASTPGGVTPLPTVPANITKRLADFGLSVQAPRVDQTTQDTGAKVTGSGLTITLDTAVMKSKLDLGWLLDPFLALLPTDLRTQISPWLEIAPKIAFVLGTATSQSTATPAYVGESPPPLDTGSTGGGDFSGGGFGPSGNGSGAAPIPTTGPTTPVAIGRQWPVFPGVPWYLFVLGLGGAAVIAYGLRRYVGLMFGTAGCDRGAAGGIPNLRER